MSASDSNDNDGELPRLFQSPLWSAVPDELEYYLAAEDVQAKRERFQREGRRPSTMAVLQPLPDRFAKEGVERVARRLLNRMQAACDNELSRNSSYRKRELPAARKESREWTYLLLSYCRKHQAQPPDALMRLLFKSLDLSEFKPDEKISAALGLAAIKKENRAKYLEAAKRDGIADAAGETLTAYSLGKDLDVSINTITAWRNTPEYAEQRAGIAADASEGEIDRHGWNRIFRKQKMRIRLIKPTPD